MLAQGEYQLTHNYTNYKVGQKEDNEIYTIELQVQKILSHDTKDNTSMINSTKHNAMTQRYTTCKIKIESTKHNAMTK